MQAGRARVATGHLSDPTRKTGDDGKTEPQRPEPIMQVPIKYNKDSVKDDL